MDLMVALRDVLVSMTLVFCSLSFAISLASECLYMLYILILSTTLCLPYFRQFPHLRTQATVNVALKKV